MRVLVAVLGNPDAGDDAFGALVARELAAAAPPRVQVADLCRQGPAALLDHLNCQDVLVIVDAVLAPGRQPGEVVDLDWKAEARPALVHESTLSTHRMSVAAQLELASVLGIGPPRTRLLGAVAVSSSQGDLPSAAMCSAAREVAARIRREY